MQRRERVQCEQTVEVTCSLVNLAAGESHLLIDLSNFNLTNFIEVTAKFIVTIRAHSLPLFLIYMGDYPVRWTGRHRMVFEVQLLLLCYKC